MVRIRAVFEKRGLMTFINHMDLPVMFARAARRAGLAFEYTRGFTPRPKISLGPPLAVGVIGLDEPADFWFEKWDEGDLERWNAKMPDGIRFLRSAEADGPALSKVATAVIYRLTGIEDKKKTAEILDAEIERSGILLANTYENCSGELVMTVGDPGRCGAGNIVRSLIENGVISGWSDILLTRSRVGLWKSGIDKILPLV